MMKLIITILYLIVFVNKSGGDINIVEDSVEVTTPRDAVFYKRIGTMYPSVNVAHIRVTLDLMAIEGLAANV